jgi:uncharacterized cupredoxin-like copper-binding protein
MRRGTMNAHFRIAFIALCGMLLGLPAAQAAEDLFHTRNVYIELDTSEDGDFRALPGNLTLQAGEHYRLELVNFSPEQHHIMMAPEFDKAIVTKGIRTYPYREVIRGASLSKGISLLPGARVEIYFQPKQEGSYKLFCEEQTHTRAGMEVAVDIRR